MKSIENIKTDFPFFTTHSQYVYLDNAATSQTPQIVIDGIKDYYENYCANVHRGAYKLSGEASKAYEQARTTVGNFIKATREEIVFTKGTTDSLNMVARMLEKHVTDKHNIVVTRLCHHAAFVTMQQLAKRSGAEFRILELDENNQILTHDIESKIDTNTIMVTAPFVSHITGTILNTKKIIKRSQENDAVTVIDAAQAVGHMSIDIEKIETDFLAFSGHKMYGPTGIGVLYGNKKVLQRYDPAYYGGGMIEEVFDDGSTWTSIPHRFEAGTPPIAQVIGLSKAIDFIEKIGIDKIKKHEQALFTYAKNNLLKLPYIKIIVGDRAQNIISFTISDVHPHDIAGVLDEQNIAIRAGHHCAMPFITKNKLKGGTARISFGIYNTKKDIDKLVEGLHNVKELFL